MFIASQKSGLKWHIIPFLVTLVLGMTTPLFALAINATAPSFTLTTLEGKKVSLRDYQGKMVILKLGTTWCPGCRDQSKELQKVETLLKERKITLIEIFLDDPADAIRAYQREHVMQGTVVTLLGDERLMRDYGVYAIPRLLILSAEQKILQDSTGMSAQQIKAQILQNDKKILP